MYIHVYLEHADIDLVKADQGSVESDVCLCELGSSEVALASQDGLHAVQSSKHLTHCHVVRLLLRSKPCSIHPVVNVPVNIQKRLETLFSIYENLNWGIYNYTGLTGRSSH